MPAGQAINFVWNVAGNCQNHAYIELEKIWSKKFKLMIFVSLCIKQNIAPSYEKFNRTCRTNFNFLKFHLKFGWKKTIGLRATLFSKTFILSLNHLYLFLEKWK